MSPRAGPAGSERQTAPEAVVSGPEDGGEDAPAGEGAAVLVGCRRGRSRGVERSSAPGGDSSPETAAPPRHHPQRGRKASLFPSLPGDSGLHGPLALCPPGPGPHPSSPGTGAAPSPSAPWDRSRTPAPRDPSGGARRRRSPRSSRRRDGAGGKCGRRGPGGCAATAATGRALWWRRLTRRGEAVLGAAAPSRPGPRRSLTARRPLHRSRQSPSSQPLRAPPRAPLFIVSSGPASSPTNRSSSCRRVTVPRIQWRQAQRSAAFPTRVRQSERGKEGRLSGDESLEPEVGEQRRRRRETEGRSEGV